MKKLVFLLLLSFPIALFAQEKVSANNDTAVFYFVEKSPEYPGGMESYYKEVGKLVKYPPKAKKYHKEGQVIVQFVVEKDGSVSGFKILKDDVGYGAGKNVIKAMKKLKRWIPGETQGRPVRCSFLLPVHFRLP